MNNQKLIYLGADCLMTACGDRAQTYAALEAGVSGLKQDSALGMIAGRIPDCPSVEGCTKLEALLVSAIRTVCREAGIDAADPGLGIVLSTTKGNIELLPGAILAEGDVAEQIPQRAFLGSTASKIQEILGLAQQPLVISNACISGVSAFVVGRRLILSGRCTRVIVAGCDTLSRFIATGFESFKSVSLKPCKPFDAERDGLSIGEACGAVLLTTEASEALAPAVLLEGGAVSDDANHISGPSRTGDGLFFAIDNAMRQAGVDASQIGFVNTHGTGTAYNDEMESKAVTLAGLQDKPLNSLKGYFGHTFGAAGVIETLACAEEIRRLKVYGTAGFSTLGVPCHINVSSESVAIETGRCVKTASGFGGCNAAVVLALASLGDYPSDEATIAEMETIASYSLDNGDQPFAEYIREQYRTLGDANMKFFKMSDLAKTAYIAAENLLRGHDLHADYEERDIAIILSNRSSSLDDDALHQRNIDHLEGASPAVFVYTLPNVAAGEVCIRNKFKGDNTFFIEDAPSSLCEDYTRYLLTRGHAKAVIWGWCEQLGNNCKAELKLSITK